MTPPSRPDTVIPQVIPPSGSRLEQLLDMREAARAAFREAKNRLEAIEAGIKTDVAAACPGEPVIGIAAGPRRPALRLCWHEGTWYVPVESLREKHPEVWDELRTQKRGSWQLHELDGNEP